MGIHDDDDEEHPTTREIHEERVNIMRLVAEWQALYGARGPLLSLFMDGEFHPQAFSACGCVVTEIEG
jgi:hypothetical protein